ncbi:sulfatase [Phytoactinopolyspora endophytica]|uniref:sulfatase family protein n=1 Tax=Phytoactinopolyspora endophytica TaxID=1642495 RepID=UPI00197CA138|nr:sulfatase [Phytoactinopolyspora endophytica]
MRATLNAPNILFAIADDASHMSAYGHRFVRTPNFDQVAEHGVLFTNAFTSNPKCAPARASILTGMHSWQLEEAANHFGIFPAKFAVFPDLLEQAGYHIGFTGKGWAPGDWKAGGFTRNPAGPEYNDIRLTPPAHTGISSVDYAGNFDAFLDARPDDSPFFFWYGGHEPHRDYIAGEGTRAGKSIDDVDVPPYLPDDDVVKNDLLDYAHEIEWFDQHLGRMIDTLARTGQLENTIIVVTSDNGMPFPRVKGQMYEQDFNLPLAIRWDARAPAGRVIHDLISFIDFAPTFLQAATVDAHAQIEGTSLIDLLTSDRSGWIDPTRDRAYLGRERHDIGRENDLGYPVRCVRTRDYLYVRNFHPERWPAGNPQTGFTNVDDSPTKTLILDQYYQHETDHYFQLAFAKRPAEELYNITTDPACLHNLADDPDHQTIKNALWRDLERKLVQTRDPRVLGHGDIFETYEYTGQKGHSWQAYLNGTLTKTSYPESSDT